MTPPVEPARVDNLVRWLLEHGDAFTEETLRARLLAAGHSPADVDAAFAIFRLRPNAKADGVPRTGPASGGAVPQTSDFGQRAATSNRGVLRRRDAVLAFLAAIGAILGIPLLLTAFGAGALAAPAFLVALIATLVGWGASRTGEHPGVAAGLGSALLLVIVLPIVAVVAVFGYCLVAGGRLA